MVETCDFAPNRTSWRSDPGIVLSHDACCAVARLVDDQTGRFAQLDPLAPTCTWDDNLQLSACHASLASNPTQLLYKDVLSLQRIADLLYTSLLMTSGHKAADSSSPAAGPITRRCSHHVNGDQVVEKFEISPDTLAAVGPAPARMLDLILPTRT